MRRVLLVRLTSYFFPASGTLLALLVATAEATVIHGPITNPANGHAYRLLDTTTWTASESEAIRLGGHLVTINNGAENSWVYDTFVPLLPAGVSTIWLGLNDAQNEGTFVWASGEAVTYTKWIRGQPDDAHAGEDYAHMFTPGGAPTVPAIWGKWNDFPNDGAGSRVYGLVETVGTVPEPSSFWLLATGLFSVFSLYSRTKRRQAHR